MQINSPQFKTNAVNALLNEQLQSALKKSRSGFVNKRHTAVSSLNEFEQLRQRAVTIKNYVLSHLDQFLEQFEKNVIANGGQVHWAGTPEQGVKIIQDICLKAKAKQVAKGKSMISEEMGLNQALEGVGIEVVETDLGEYIIQLAAESPSHIIAPAIHKTREQITELFHKHHAKYGITEKVEEVATIVNEARTVLRSQFVEADVGIIGANFLLADSGSTVLVTNEGNGDLSSSLPKVQIVTASIEKVIPSFQDLSVFLRLLGRSATGQEMSAYTSIYSGPARNQDMDGPTEFHVVLLDNGRTKMLEGDFWEMLRCIRCGACMNHCPVYQAVGGHAYGWIYPGPMGSVWTPLLVGLKNAANLPNACSLNGRCEQVCPSKIPLPKLLRTLRNQLFERGLIDWKSRYGLKLWLYLAQRPLLFRTSMKLGSFGLKMMAGKKGSIRRLPLGGAWTDTRDFPAAAGNSFVSKWNAGQRN